LITYNDATELRAPSDYVKVVSLGRKERHNKYKQIIIRIQNKNTTHKNKQIKQQQNKNKTKNAY
jgi:hypothetical protein